MNGFRKNISEDVTEEEFNLYLLPHLNQFESYMKEYIIPNMCAFYIKSGYETGGLELNSFKIYLNDVMAFLNDNYKVTLSLKNKVKKCLKIKYNLEVVSEDPLVFREELVNEKNY